MTPGTKLGPYEIVALLGAGGMGEVCRARDTRLHREVAIKVLLPGFATDPERLQRFEQEARAAAALNHPNIASTTVGRAIWSPDGSRIIFIKVSNGKELNLFERASNGAGGEQPVLQDGSVKFPLSWSPDGRFVAYVVAGGSADTGNDIWILPLFGDRKPFPYLQTRFSEFAAQFSPDGRWVAYRSNESGRGEVYVASDQARRGRCRRPGASGRDGGATAGKSSGRLRTPR